jgi:hypothetical protein
MTNQQRFEVIRSLAYGTMPEQAADGTQRFSERRERRGI